MAVRFPSVASKTIQNAGVGNSSEVNVFVSPPVSPMVDSGLILILWEVVCSLGAAQTTFTCQLRRGVGIGGALVNVANSISTVAGTVVRFSGAYFDLPGIVAGQQYSFNVTANGAAAAGTVTDGCIQVVSL